MHVERKYHFTIRELRLINASLEIAKKELEKFISIPSFDGWPNDVALSVQLKIQDIEILKDRIKAAMSEEV